MLVLCSFLMPQKFNNFKLLILCAKKLIYWFSIIVTVYASQPTSILPYRSIYFSFHDSMDLDYDAVKLFSLKRFRFFVFQYWLDTYDLPILSPFKLTLLMQLFSSLISCYWMFILQLPGILFSFQYFHQFIPQVSPTFRINLCNFSLTCNSDF